METLTILKLITVIFVIIAILVIFCYQDLKKDREESDKLFNDPTDQF